MMAELGFTEFADPGFEAFRRDGEEVRFFWWSSRRHGLHLNVPRASLVIRTADRDDIHVSMVDWPSEDQPLRPWADVAAEVRGHVVRDKAIL